MNSRKLIHLWLRVTLTLAFLIGHGITQAQPMNGDWRVPTRFGQFVLTVGPNRTEITKLATTFSSYTFGGITQNGTVTSMPSPGWQITNNQFTINTNISPTGSIRLTITGTFVPAGDQASGTWTMVVNGQTDAASWGPVTFTSGGTAQWIRTSGPSGGQVNCFAVLGTSLFAGTDAGGVYLSTNDGTSWTQVNTGLTSTRVFALAATTGGGGSGMSLFAGTGGGIFLSTNNGTSWTKVSTGLTGTSTHALVISGTNLFAGTFGGGVFLSANNGTSWIPVNTGLTNTNVPALAISGVNLFAATTTGGVFLSANNGASWTAVNAGLANPSVPALAVSGTSIFAGTYDGVFLSTNNGTNWTQTSLTNTVVTSFALSPASGGSGTNLFAGTIVGVFLSTNNGMSWTAVNTGLTDANVWSLAVSGANLFAGTMYTGVWRRPLAEMVTFVEGFTDLPTSYCLHQNYPNPFNPSTTISYTLPKTSVVALRIFNTLGQEVAALVNERKEAGFHEVTWNASSIPSGVYFYRLQARQMDGQPAVGLAGGQAGNASTSSARGYVETKKAILLK
jgi:hypothetical protein